MRIVLNGSYAPSLVNFRGPLVRELLRRGHEIHCVAPDVDAGTRASLESWGARVHQVTLSRAGLAPHQDLAYFLRLRRLFAKVKPNFVLSYTIKPNIWGSLAAQSLNIQSAAMITGLGLSFMSDGGIRQRVAARMGQFLYRRSTKANCAVIFQNSDDRDDFLARGCLADADKTIMVNGSGVDMTHYAVSPLPEKPVFLMIARLLGNKGVREYGKAAVQLLSEKVAARFLLVGYVDEGPDGIEQQELQQWQAAGLEYLGPLDDVRPVLAASSVFVLPSYREGTPRSVLEAMATGRPVITTDAPGCRQTIVDGESGILVPVKDCKRLAGAMKALADAPALRASMGEAARRRCESKFAVDDVNADLLMQLGIE